MLPPPLHIPCALHIMQNKKQGRQGRILERTPKKNHSSSVLSRFTQKSYNELSALKIKPKYHVIAYCTSSIGGTMKI